ncbi:leucine--tRNA ligase [Dyadobacter fanqingshengii]|uniref:Leucine--tRNA ligase n=1 Tax=Dyadobacter fanqingshengii TaxID=2906443 RepID=A0A9X1PCS7_9BACT|nr:leucine--tRNA ligase [Dyadobacter fanqingshengii]MCF0042789.1 leucine--tRNA ligase [Dyadobacter fanqingshengii]USJ35991.1 leucine--tRNA ligase [Dyadobacter fanqingshengii]
MSDYSHREIEQKWQQYWESHGTFNVENQSDLPKYYVLDMFPYPSGAGLHVGHPLGYIASDIYSRYKRLKGFNVLHPMGFDSFGLPAEQYAIQTGQHPAITTEQNITRYIEQLKNLGFSYDWKREVRTSDPNYYKWTQWIFIELFKSWYNNDSSKAEPIESLISIFEKSGNKGVNAPCDEDTPIFTAQEWSSWSEEDQYKLTLKYRLTYVADATVNWCAGLGSVLSNDEVKDGVSERGGFPVVQKLMRQWMMRITAYAQRLIDGLDTIDWTESLKEQQRNWIGRSVGALVKFDIDGHDNVIEVFTTRVDTIYGVTFMVLAPEHELVDMITTPEQRGDIDVYIASTKKKSERDRMSDVKTVSGAFTGAYAVNPFNDEKIPVYIADYVLAGYGTGAVMAVPSGDQRDWNFAQHFNLPIIPILDSQKETETQADSTKDGHYINSGMINGLTFHEANKVLINWLEEKGIGKGKINYRLRDAVFSRQRYWGEPVPVFYKNDSTGQPLPYLLGENELPLNLPEVDKYLPTENGEPPLGRAQDWAHGSGNGYELSTMPGWAGSSWYWYRYMDPKNQEEFASKESIDYWRDVDLYIGGTEHATGHLLYSRFWNKFLKDRGFVPEEEPFKKLINQGMIQGRSNFVYRVKGDDYSSPVFVSAGLRAQYDVSALHVDVNIVENDVLDVEKFKATRRDIVGENPTFILEDGKYVCGVEVEKMSKSKFNVVNPDDIVERYGADTLRLYEMFLGPLEQAKPWNTNGIDGTYRFIRKLWRLFYNDAGQWMVKDVPAKPEELKILHKTIKKIEEDIENFSFNTAVSAFMVCVNELGAVKCQSKAVLQELVVLLSPYAPHISEELWDLLGNEKGMVSKAAFPKWELQHVTDSVFEYPIQINGKVRASLTFALDTPASEIEKEVLANETVQRWMEGKDAKKVIVVPRRIVNVVI